MVLPVYDDSYFLGRFLFVGTADDSYRTPEEIWRRVDSYAPRFLPVWGRLLFPDVFRLGRIATTLKQQEKVAQGVCSQPDLWRAGVWRLLFSVAPLVGELGHDS